MLNKHGQFWDRVTEQAQPIAEAVRLIESLIPADRIKNATVLDAGCGAGDYSAALTQLGAKSVCGFDVSVGSLRLAHRQTPNAKFIQASLSELPYTSESFDVVWSWGVLHYVPNAPQALREIGRVLRPDGIAIIHTLRTSFWASLERAIAKMFSSAPEWVEPLVLSTGERIVPFVSQIVTGRRPEEQTSKTVRQKLHERLFVPGDTHTFSLSDLAGGFSNAFAVQEVRPPVSDLLKRDMSITVMVRKHG